MADEQHPTVTAILTDICDLEPDDPADFDTICINFEALRIILERHIASTDR